MPTVNYDQSDYRVPLGTHHSYTGHPICTFVKVQDRRVYSSKRGPGHLEHTDVVHIEVSLARYGGASLTHCGRRFEASTYIFVTQWLGTYRTCKACHQHAMMRNWEYREVVEARADKQLALNDLI